MGGSNDAFDQVKLTSKADLRASSQNGHSKRSDSEDEGQIVTIYDQLRPKDEPRFMSHVRRWEKRVGFQTPLIWSSTIAIVVFHAVTAACTLVSIACLWVPMWQTALFGLTMGGVAGFGVTAGAHRYWCHRSYKARLPLQLILLACYSVAGQNNVFNWVRDHRVHHKYSESSADPHDARRGFFFSHVGWLMMRKRPEVLRRGRGLDMSDVTGDPLLQFHRRYFNVFKALLCFIVPTIVPPLLWGECWWYAVVSQPLLRYCLSLNFTWSVNSFAHLYGNKPYDRNIMPVENWAVSAVAMGEGWHNYHHSFPWDYRTAELGYTLNVTTALLDVFRAIGWVYDERRASPALVRALAANKGDGTHH